MEMFTYGAKPEEKKVETPILYGSVTHHSAGSMQEIDPTPIPLVAVESVINQAEISAPPASMIEAVIIQLESGFKLVKVPNFVEKAATDFTAALRKWAAGGK